MVVGGGLEVRGKRGVYCVGSGGGGADIIVMSSSSKDIWVSHGAFSLCMWSPPLAEY